MFHIFVEIKQKMEHKSEIHNYSEKVNKVKKIKRQCNSCGKISYTLTCDCGGATFKYINKIGK